jgi:plastocyanin
MNQNTIAREQNEFTTLTECRDAKRRILCATVIAFLFFACDQAALATIFNVDVGSSGSDNYMYSPAYVVIQPGDTVKWTWITSMHHTVTSGTPDHFTGLFDSGSKNAGDTFSFTFNTPGTIPYYCVPHVVCCNMIGAVRVAGTPTPTPCPSPSPRPASQAQLLNISTRMEVQTGENVLIGGFIITGTQPKKVILRAIGPSLPVAGALADPSLELNSGGTILASNDNWMDAPNRQEIIDSTIPPSNDLESAVLTTLDPGLYTAIVRGVNNTTGVGLVEAYDLDQLADAQLANISTRGFVEAGSNVMIGGFILGNGTGTTNVLIRALGPSLTGQGITGALADPTLELHDSNGALLQSNDNWKESQQCDIEATGAPPANDLESAMVVTIPTGAYTAIVVGKNGGTGVGLVELYRLP